MERTVTLADREQKRAKVLNEVLSGKVLQREAAELLGVSERQFRRILAAYKEEGVASLPHGDRGKVPHNRAQEAERDRGWSSRAASTRGSTTRT